MEIPQATTAPVPPAPDSRPRIASDFDTFLRMLTTQLQNQDPLNPMESSDFAVQLATFSGVEQQVSTNQLLQRLTDRMGGAQLTELSNWIGKEARVAAPVAFDGRAVSLSPVPSPGADTAVLLVLDQNGQVIDRVPVPVTIRDLLWDGRLADGRTAPNGTYSFRLESIQNGEIVGTSDVPSYALVTEARRASDGSVNIVLAGGAVIPSASVTALRERV